MMPSEITAERIRQAARNQDVCLSHGEWYRTDTGTVYACPMTTLALDGGLTKDDLDGDGDRTLEDVESEDVAAWLDLPTAWVDGFAWAWDNENMGDFDFDATDYDDQDRLAFSAGYEAGSKVAEEMAEEAP